MKITESHLRKIIRGAINEMFDFSKPPTSTADATPLSHDSPPQEEAPTETVDELVSKIAALASAGEIPPHLISKLQTALKQPEPTQSQMTPFGFNENKKRK